MPSVKWPTSHFPPLTYNTQAAAQLVGALRSSSDQAMHATKVEEWRVKQEGRILYGRGKEGNLTPHQQAMNAAANELLVTNPQLLSFEGRTPRTGALGSAARLVVQQTYDFKKGHSRAGGLSSGDGAEDGVDAAAAEPPGDGEQPKAKRRQLSGLHRKARLLVDSPATDSAAHRIRNLLAFHPLGWTLVRCASRSCRGKAIF